MRPAHHLRYMYPAHEHSHVLQILQDINSTLGMQASVHSRTPHSLLACLLSTTLATLIIVQTRLHAQAISAVLFKGLFFGITLVGTLIQGS